MMLGSERGSRAVCFVLRHCFVIGHSCFVIILRRSQSAATEET
jgi:hypothetical protein